MTEKELKRVQELESITSEGGHHVKDNPIKPLLTPPLDYLGSSPVGPEYPQEGLGRQTHRDSQRQTFLARGRIRQTSRSFCITAKILRTFQTL